MLCTLRTMIGQINYTLELVAAPSESYYQV